MWLLCVCLEIQHNKKMVPLYIMKSFDIYFAILFRMVAKLLMVATTGLCAATRPHSGKAGPDPRPSSTTQRPSRIQAPFTGGEFAKISDVPLVGLVTHKLTLLLKVII